MAGTFRLDRKGVSFILKNRCADAINALAESIAEQVRDAHDDVEVEVDEYTTDRGAAAVTIADPRGRQLQASDGALTRAAARFGLEVTEVAE
ncbi:hypothetical protein QSJ18_18215 [Gordonia sp. ABSL1-1]|uniref:hypothetical protein n=1 Tax=Gordonia sp. ABSL1-1 TaxID=3053923 RepID=UPI002573F553|nr:hypothetical protein [Gordonia sp. ABSL1-1]MDL9938685.1 hypothetical protein [Gordonia sp. ABSL1-1]